MRPTTGYTAAVVGGLHHKEITSMLRIGLDFNAKLTLNRAGNFTLRLTPADRIAKKTAKLEMPLRVTAP